MIILEANNFLPAGWILHREGDSTGEHTQVEVLGRGPGQGGSQGQVGHGDVAFLIHHLLSV